MMLNSNPIPLLQQAARSLTATGGRMTSQRRVILAALAECSDHPTAEEIFARVRREDSAINLSTVYRTLRWLEQQGLVASRHFEGEPHQDRFDPVVVPGSDHYHFRCRACNRIIEFDSPLLEQVKQAFTARQGGQVDSSSLILYGLCAGCAAVQP